MDVRYVLTRRGLGGAALLLTVLLAVGAGAQLLDSALTTGSTGTRPPIGVVIGVLVVASAVGLARGGRRQTAYW